MMITQELAKKLAEKVKPRTKYKAAWIAFAQDYAERNKTVIADREALRVEFELECG